MIRRRKFQEGIRLKGSTNATTLEGEIRLDPSALKFKAYVDSSERSVVTEDQTQTLTNKTYTDPVLNGDVSGTSIDTDVNLAADSDTKIASQKAVKAYVDAAVETVNDASEINYSNATSGLTATDVQAAVDEVEGRLDTAEGSITTNASAISDHIADAVDAHDASAISNVPSGNLAATDVQGALNELQTELDGKALSSDLSDHISDTVDAHDASAISNIPSGNLAATDVQTALNELQSDIDTRALDSALTSHTGASSAHGVSGDVVGTSDTQTLTNKTIDGAIITSPVQSDVKKDTQANLETYASTATNGQFCFATDTKQAYQIIDNALAPIGGGSGGLDVFYTETFEGAIKAANFTSGNNATYDNGGTLDGTLADETTSPVAGDTSLKYTMGATSTNDFIKSPAIALDAKQKGQTIGMEFYYTYNGADDDIKIVIYDDTNSQVLTTSIDFLKASSTPQRFSVQVPTNSDTANLHWGFQVVTGNSGKILVVDDIQMSTNPFVSKDFEISQYYRADGHAGFGSTATKIPYYTNERVSKGSNLVTVVNDSTNGFSITANRKLKISASFSLESASGGSALLGWSLNSLAVTTNFNSITESERISYSANSSITGEYIGHNNTVSIELEEGDILRPHTSGGTPANISTAMVSFLATAESEHIIAYNSRNAENLVIRGEGNSGGAVTSGVTNVIWTEVSDIGYGNDNWDGSTFTCPADGLYTFSGSMAFTTQALRRLTIWKNGVVYSDIAFSQGTSHPFSKTMQLSKNDTVNIRSESTGTLNNNTDRHTLDITKIGVGDLLGVPVPRTCYIKDVKASGATSGTFTSGAWRTRDLNTLEGDIEFVSLSANQFVLQAGKYEIEVSAPAYHVQRHVCKLVSDPSGSPTDISIGSGSYAGNNLVQNESTIQTTVELTSQQTFEVQHRCSLTSAAANGFGVEHSFGVDNIYTQVKITKIS